MEEEVNKIENYKISPLIGKKNWILTNNVNDEIEYGQWREYWEYDVREKWLNT